MSEAESSIYQSNLPLETKLDRARAELLDLSARNRLLNVPRFSKSAKTVDVVEERSDEIYRLLVGQSKAFTFSAGRADRTGGERNETDEDLEAADLTLPDDADLELDERGVEKRHSDTKLQTRMTPKGLQKRLLDLYHDARTLEEEQGVNVLFLALGMLRWVDPNNKENMRHAPLVLVPVNLERGTAGERFRLRARTEDMSSNLSLELYLDRVHQLRLPTFDTGEELDVTTYFNAVAEAVSTKTDWAVLPDDMVLGFFSFSKFLMYRDLDPENWPQDSRITDQENIRALLSDGFDAGEPLLSEDQAIDDHISPADMLHIVDSDGSQTLAVHDVRRGRDLVIQGPPGTGKSQTIANVIASAVADGKTVLFVSEKMAALEVVKRRLDHAGVGDACLELHSNKANKRALLEELRRTWELGSPRGEFPGNLAERLTEARDLLNEHPARIHDAHQPSGLTPYRLFGELTKLRRQGQRPVDYRLETPGRWSPDDLAERRRLVAELIQRIDDIGLPDQHPWRGVGLQMVLPTTLERLVPRLQELVGKVRNLQVSVGEVAQQIDLERVPTTFAQTQDVRQHADILAQAPSMSGDALSADVWQTSASEIRDLIDTGRQYEKQHSEIASHLVAGAVDISIDGVEDQLRNLPKNFTQDAFGRASVLASSVPPLMEAAGLLAKELGRESSPRTLAEVYGLITTGERVAAAPDASPEAFAATAWEHGVEQAADLASAVEVYEKSKAAIGDRLADVAWSSDVAAARQALATNTGIFKVFSSDYRKAKALARSLLRNPDTATPEIVELFDTLMKGQAAAKRIRDGETLGRAAYGPDWRGESSSSQPLLALASWMRTLKGLGGEPRFIAARLTDRRAIGDRAAQVVRLADSVRDKLEAFYNDLGDRAAGLLEQAASADRVDLDLAEARARNIAWADDVCRSIMRAVPETVDEKIGLLGKLSRVQRSARSIDDSAALGRQAFAELWDGRASAWETLGDAASWIENHKDLRYLASRLDDRTGIAEKARSLETDAGKIVQLLVETASSLNSDTGALFGDGDLSSASFDEVSERLDGWLGNTEQLSKWVSYNDRAQRARATGLSSLVDAMSTGELATGAAQQAFEMAYHEALLEEMVAADPELGRFDGHLHSRQVREFANMDRERIKASSLEVVRAHHRRIPSKFGSAGPVGVLRGEMAKRSRHIPIRQLMHRAGPAVQALKPVMMMSPLSVAQFLTPGKVSFDLLVMDEASQIQPVDALGAVARAKQIVVVGDERQLPPTKFFAKMTGSQEEDDEDDSTKVADIESILGLCSARGLPQRMLRWHYRSRHQSLIAVSNSQFYQNKLFIVPSPYTAEAGMGLRFHHVPDGVFDSGKTYVNAVEARVVAEAVIRHAKTHPQLSLGVAAFSVSQRRAIQDELELLRRLNPETEDFFHAHPSEPFFVKNLENVQGDERDVIMISVGYARNEQGYMAMRFGPLGAEGGERRLNVLISRAKRRCEVFASITDEDIDLERGKGKGIFAFKLFLHYARTGRLSIAQSTERNPDSVFEEQVADAIRDRGYDVHPQVGIAGFFVDLAVSDTNRPGRYLLGIECDGASYHSARSARDRDRLRQAVLEDHGWIIHRIWSTDWFQRPQEQLERVVAAIEAAKVELDERAEGGVANHRAVPVEIVTVDRGDVTEIGLVDVDTSMPADRIDTAYVEATIIQPPRYELHETPIGLLADLVAQIVQVESPVHCDEVVARIRDAYGLQRAGGRIQAAVDLAIDRAVAHRGVMKDGRFLSMPDAPLEVRNRSDVLSPGLRKPENLPPAELAVGVERIVMENLGATDDEAVTALSRLLGFKSTSAQLRAVIASVIDDMISKGRVARVDGLLTTV